MFNQAVFLLCMVYVCSAVKEADWQCHTDKDCSTDTCCSKVPMFLLVGKRDEAHLMPDPVLQPVEQDIYQSVTCRPYRQLNATCKDIGVDMMNGDCGCAPGLHCKYFPELDTFWHHLMLSPITMEPPASKRAIPGTPEAYKCVPRGP